MDLQPLYILRECLEDTAIAGTDTMADDYRLKRAVETFRPLAGESPVFQRIHSQMTALLAAGAEARPAQLLDVIGLIAEAERARGDTGASGELIPLEGGTGRYVHALYSQLQPVISALDGSGSGRITILEEAWANHPEYFSDDRVMPHLAAALGNAHEELEKLLASILTAQGKRAVPFLKDGFAPDGKREMERRVYWVARLAGAEEAEWYRDILPDCEKEVRETVIAALGLSQENAALLCKLYHRESGKARDAALRALARMEDEESRALWAEELETRPDCPPCLEGVNSVLAADMAARELRGTFDEALARERRECTQAELLTLAHATYAAYGKYSDALRETWLSLAEQMDVFEQLCPDRSVRQWDLNAAEMLEKCLMETVLWNPCENVCTLARELGGRYPSRFLGAALLTDLLTRPAEAFDLYKKYIVKNSIFHKENDAERANRIQIMRALAAVQLTEEEGRHIPFSRKDALTGAPERMIYRLPEFDPRWAETLGNPRVNQDGAVFDLESAWSMAKQMFRMEAIESEQGGGS